MMESSRESVARELREELGVDATVDRLLWIVENFFLLGGRRFHEVGLYFRVLLAADSPVNDKTRPIPFREGVSLDLEARWIPLPDLAGLNLLPEFLRKELLDLPSETRHIVHREI
jgi:8-oxo-dGTP pyrophosphatase MutT (NUDIX family)